MRNSFSAWFCKWNHTLTQLLLPLLKGINETRHQKFICRILFYSTLWYENAFSDLCDKSSGLTPREYWAEDVECNHEIIHTVWSPDGEVNILAITKNWLFSNENYINICVTIESHVIYEKITDIYWSGVVWYKCRNPKSFSDQIHSKF